MEPTVLAQIEAHWGLIVIIAFLLGMGTPRPWAKEDRRTGEERRTYQPAELRQILDLLELLVYPHRPAEPDKKKDQEGNGPT